jgi:cold shock CspA family protein/tetratricopeptide (TPR) repeat protein
MSTDEFYPRAGRARLYRLVEAFELDLRRALDSYLLDHLTEQEVLGLEFAEADRLRAADLDNSASITDYLNLRPCYDTLMRNKAKLPGDLIEGLSLLGARLDAFVPVRNRIMHFRPLQVDDSDLAFSVLHSLSGRHWKKVFAVLTALSDSDWDPEIDEETAAPGRALHNLPTPDYDDTGFVGRETEVKKIHDLLESSRAPVLTITGEGGIGKTALALEVAYRIVDDPKSRFDCVLWVSLKSEHLTADGVRTISNAVRGITGASQMLTGFMRTSFGETVAELSDMLVGLDALIVIDNLESADGEEVKSLYDALPETVRYLFTSRVGLGEIERRFPIAALIRNDARKLFRKLAREHRVEAVMRLSDVAVDQILTRLRDSPLALRWWILSVASGHEPRATLLDQRALLDFCVRNVVDALSAPAAEMLRVMKLLGRPVGFDEFAVYMTLGMDELRAASQELSRGSLTVYPRSADGELVRQVALSDSARLFLPDIDDNADWASRVLGKHNEYLRSEERRRNEQRAGALGPNVVRIRTSEDSPSAYLLRLALTHSKRADWDTADKYVSRAQSLNPDYWEVSRVGAFIASIRGFGAQASALYQDALLKADSDFTEGVVNYYFAGHLARRMFDLPAAIPRAEEAHRLLFQPQTGQQLGNFYVWNGEFEKGQNLITEAAEGAEGKDFIRLRTSLIDCGKRWAEYYLGAHQFGNALEKGLKAFADGAEVISQGTLDDRLCDATLDGLTVALRACSHLPGDIEIHHERIRKMVEFVNSHSQSFIQAVEQWPAFLNEMEKFNRDIEASGLQTMNVRERSDPTDAIHLKEGEYLGKVLLWHTNFGFIEHAEFPKNVFYHRGDFKAGQEQLMEAGAPIIFELGEPADKGERAARVRALSDSTN